MIESDGPAPYAPPATLMSVVNRHRQVAIPHFDVPTLERIGVSESLAPRTMQALRLLDLVSEEGNPTPAFEALRKSATPDFQGALASVVRDAYGPVFSIVDPTTATVSQIEDAFRHFSPAGQRGRMVTLFVGLMIEAGMRDDNSKRQIPQKQRPASVRNAARLPERAKSVAPPEVPVSERSALSRGGAGDTYRVQLRSGGSVSVVMDVNLFELSVEDRQFVIDLVDQFKEYDSTGSISLREAEAAPGPR